MYKTGADAHDLVVNALQAGQKLLNAEIAQGADPVGFALKSRQVQGHGSGGLEMECGKGAAGKLFLRFNTARETEFSQWSEGHASTNDFSRESGKLRKQAHVHRRARQDPHKADIDALKMQAHWS